MSKKRKVWLAVAAALIVIGVFLFVGVMSAMKWDFTKLSTGKYETKYYEITEDFQNISITSQTADIRFVPSEDGRTVVTCHDQQRLKHVVSVQDGTLTVKRVNERKWYDYIGIHFGSQEITVALPEGVYGDLTVDSGTSEVKVPAGYQFANVDISLSTGNVTCAASALEEIKIKTSTGDIRVENVTAAGISLTASTGKITASGVNCSAAGEMSVRVTTGKVALTDLQCGNLKAKGSTGSITLKNVTAAGSMDIRRSTGDVTFESCDAAEMFVKTDTGDVKGTLLTEKVFIVRTDTGSIEVPKTVTGGRCEIETDTGDIKIRIP